MERERFSEISATSMVTTPHCGACSLSVDLRTDEIPATGGHRFFAHATGVHRCKRSAARMDYADCTMLLLPVSSELRVQAWTAGHLLRILFLPYIMVKKPKYVEDNTMKKIFSLVMILCMICACSAAAVQNPDQHPLLIWNEDDALIFTFGSGRLSLRVRRAVHIQRQSHK